MAKKSLIDEYVAGVELLEQTVAGMTREQALARPIAGKWSTLEVVAHLADFEPIFADRIKRVIAMDHPLLVAADEEPFARELAYHERDLEAEVQLIALTRRQLASILYAKPEAVLEREGVHSYLGLVKVEDLLVKATRHIEHHVPFIEDKKRALGIGSSQLQHAGK